jgi:hypothetical protein
LRDTTATTRVDETETLQETEALPETLPAADEETVVPIDTVVRRGYQRPPIRRRTGRPR